MPTVPVVVSLPIADRPTSFRFYRDGLGLEPWGEPAEDGVPEPLQFDLAAGVRLMLIPSGGFGWVVADHAVAAPGTSECMLTLTPDTREQVDAVIVRAEQAGASVVSPAGDKPWGYSGTFADPDGHLWMVRSPNGWDG
jgi:predicted lactoylglutathione lyase